METEVKAVQLKASSPMEVTESGMETVAFETPKKTINIERTSV